MDFLHLWPRIWPNISKWYNTSECVHSLIYHLRVELTKDRLLTCTYLWITMRLLQIFMKHSLVCLCTNINKQKVNSLILFRVITNILFIFFFCVLVIRYVALVDLRAERSWATRWILKKHIGFRKYIFSFVHKTKRYSLFTSPPCFIVWNSWSWNHLRQSRFYGITFFNPRPTNTTSSANRYKKNTQESISNGCGAFTFCSTFSSIFFQTFWARK